MDVTKVRFRLLPALLVVLATNPALAAPQPAPPASDERTPESQRTNTEIVITGSRIPRPNLTAASPITVVDAKEVKLQGAVLTEQLINALPQVVPDQGAFLSNGASGTPGTRFG